MKGLRFSFCLFLLASLLAFNGFSFQEDSDSIPLPLAEPVPPIYLADTLCIHQPDNAPLFTERLIVNNSETIFGTPHLLLVDNFSEKPLGKDEGNEWLFFVFFVSAVLIFVSLLYFPYYSRQFFRSIIDTVQFRKIKKEEYFENKTPKWILSINFLVVISLMVIMTHTPLDTLDVLVDFNFITRFGVIFGATLVFFLSKRGVERFLSWVFDQKSVLEKHLEVTVFFNNLSGIILLPLVIAYHYNPQLLRVDFLWIILLVAFLIKIVRRSLVWFRSSKLPLFYIILYLCTVELAPLLLIIRIATTTQAF